MNKTMKFAMVGAVAGAFSLFSASESEAQICVGFPTTGGQMAAALSANFPTGGNMVGGEFNYNFAAPLGAFVGVTYNNPDAGDATTSLGGGVAFDFPVLTQALPAGIVACPTAAVIVANVEDTGLLSIPLGVGFGTTLALGEGGLSLSPYVVPQLRIRTGGEGVETTTGFLLSGGALINITPSIYAGATVNRVFVEAGDDSLFGLNIGVTF
jgi:hypothetical protein